jgi:hypothetical protein
VFIVDGHSVFTYFSPTNSTKTVRGVYMFNRTGVDSDGLPNNVDQLRTIGDPGRLTKFSDLNIHPEVNAAETAQKAKELLVTLKPACPYSLEKSWRDAAGQIKLPFYNYVFTDSVAISYKSTSGGLVLQHYEDRAFVGATP